MSWSKELFYLTKDRRRITRAGLNGGMANLLLLLLPEDWDICFMIYRVMLLAFEG
jgi:hypothetical protein